MNYSQPSTGRRSDLYLCTAIDRADAATCQFYERGKDGFCRWTIREREFVVLGKDGKKAKKVLKEHVTGECWCERAMKL